MSTLWNLYLSYVKLASLSMASAFIIFSLVAGFLLGDPLIVIGTLGAAFVVAASAYLMGKSSSVRILWRALDESGKHKPKGEEKSAEDRPPLNTKALRELLPLRRRVLSWGVSERMYVIGTVVLCFFLPLFFLTLFLQVHEHFRSATLSVLIGFGFFAGGALVDLIKVVLLIWRNTVGKFVLGLLAGLVANISYVFARAEVNRLTEMDPSKFTTAVATLSVILTPLIWLEAILIVLLLIFMAGYMASLFYHYFKKLMFGPLILEVRNSIPYRFLLDKRRYRGKSRSARLDAARLFGVINLFIFLMLPTLYLEGSVRRMKGFFTKVFVETETYSSSRCPNHRTGERVAFLDGGKILVAMPDGAGGYTFEIRVCE